MTDVSRIKLTLMQVMLVHQAYILQCICNHDIDVNGQARSEDTDKMLAIIDDFFPEEGDLFLHLHECIGKRVSKKTKKRTNPRPFKSTFQINTISSITVNPNTGYLAYTFIEDDSCVDIRTCEILEDESTSQ